VTAVATRARGQATRERLLAIGDEMFAGAGYERVSTAEIARRAGVADGLLFHYFRSKRAFYLEIVRRRLARLNARLEANREPDLDRWLRREIDIFLDSVTERPLDAGSGFGTDAELRALIEGEQDWTARRLLRRLGVERPTAEQHIAARGWVGFAMECAYTWQREHSRLSRAKVRARIAAALAAVPR